MLFKFCIVFVVCMFISLFLLADLELKLGHTALQLQELHIEGSLLATERRGLLLEARVLGLLVSVVAFHFFFDFEVFVGEGLANLLSLHGEDTLKCVLLRAQHLHLALMEVEFLSELTNHVLVKQGVRRDSNLTSSDESFPFRLDVFPMVDEVADAPAAMNGLFWLAFDCW